MTSVYDLPDEKMSELVCLLDRVCDVVGINHGYIDGLLDAVDAAVEIAGDDA